MGLIEHVGCRVGSCESYKLGPGCGTFPPNMELHRQLLEYEFTSLCLEDGSVILGVHVGQ